MLKTFALYGEFLWIEEAFGVNHQEQPVGNPQHPSHQRDFHPMFLVVKKSNTGGFNTFQQLFPILELML